MANKDQNKKKEAKKPANKDVSVKASDKKTGKSLPKEEKGRAGQGTAIRSCKCEHEFQDRRYGKQMRVHNVGGTKDSPKYNCTVCSSTSR